MASLLRSRVIARAVRQFSVASTTSAQAKLDPIQQLYISKIQEYKKMASSGKIPGFDEKGLQEQLDRVSSTYGADKEDFSKFPSLQFSDPQIEMVEYEGAPEQNVLELVEEFYANPPERATSLEHSQGALRKAIWEAEYKPKHERAGTLTKHEYL